MPPRQLIAGNWKMNGLIAQLDEVRTLMARMADALAMPDVLVCPPATLIAPVRELAGQGPLLVGGQDCHTAALGAHTGDISAVMLRDLGCSHVIVGHSERRADHGETDAIVAAKATAAHDAGLAAIICVGETEEERDRGDARVVVERQLAGSVPGTAAPANTTIAYEPVWAIGTGRTPSEDEVAEVHAAIRAWLNARFGTAGNEMRVLYGGSVKPSNAATLLALDNVDGALVGGASLKAVDFWGIVAASPAQ